MFDVLTPNFTTSKSVCMCMRKKMGPHTGVCLHREDSRLRSLLAYPYFVTFHITRKIYHTGTQVVRLHKHYLKKKKCQDYSQKIKGHSMDRKKSKTMEKTKKSRKRKNTRDKSISTSVMVNSVGTE